MKLNNTTPGWKPNPAKYIALIEREYNIPRDDLMIKYSWEDVQFRVNQIPTERIVSYHEGLKPKKYRELYLKALCDEEEIKSDLLDDQYEAFMKRRNKTEGE